MAEELSELQREYLLARRAYRQSAQALREGRQGLTAHKTAMRRFYSLAERLSPAERARVRRIAGADPWFSERGFISGVAPSARSTAARGLSKAAKVAGPVGLGIDALAAYNQAEGPWSFSKWMAHEEEGLTKKPVLGLIGLGERGLVSPSELPPPEVLSPDRIKAVEATQGVVGVAPDNESPNVTRQELRAYISNKVAKGKKLPAWAEKITSMKGGRLSIKPFDPRAEARQEAAKRPRTWGNVLD